MRSRILSSLLLATVLAPPVWAQTPDEPEPETGDETQGSDIVDEAPSRPSRVNLPPGQTGRESAPGEVHTVQSGDTLWDLSQRYLGSPWYWPKVWSYNPEIANPHWIYPGNNVRFFAAGEEVPSRVEAGVGPVSDSDASEPTETDANGVEVEGRVGYTPKAGQQVMTQAFVTTRELDEAGRIEGSSTGAEMLSFPFTAYVRFKRAPNAKLGDKYVVFHTVQAIRHPVTHQPAGFLTEFVGTLRVTGLGKDYIKAQIMDTWNPIVRGDLVGPQGERTMEMVVPRRNEKEVRGVVLTALVPYLALTAEHHVVVIDQGSANGVQPGNIFTVTRSGDPARREILARKNPFTKKQEAPNLPIEDIAQCLITEVKERTSNCIITSSLQEVNIGDPVVMYVNTPPTAQR